MPSKESGAGDVQGMWSSFDYGLVHFVLINTETDFDGSPEGASMCLHPKEVFLSRHHCLLPLCARRFTFFGKNRAQVSFFGAHFECKQGLGLFEGSVFGPRGVFVSFEHAQVCLFRKKSRAGFLFGHALRA